MTKKWYQLPVALVVAHGILIVVFWLWTLPGGGETGAAWEYMVGTLDFGVYYTVGVPRSVSSVGHSPPGSYAYALWFGLTGSVQWFLLGVVGHAVFGSKRGTKAGAQPEAPADPAGS